MATIAPIDLKKIKEMADQYGMPEEMMQPDILSLVNPTAVAPVEFPKLAVRGGLKELFGHLRDQARSIKSLREYLPEMNEFTLANLKDMITTYGPRIIGVHEGAKATAEHAPGMIRRIPQVMSQLHHPEGAFVNSEVVVGGANRGKWYIYPGSEGLGTKISKVSEGTKLSNLHEGTHFLSAHPPLHTKPIKVGDTWWSGPLAKFFREVPSSDELTPWFREFIKEYGYDPRQLLYLSDPSEVMARGTASELYGRIYGYDKIDLIPHQHFNFLSWPQDLDPLWRKVADEAQRWMR